MTRLISTNFGLADGPAVEAYKRSEQDLSNTLGTPIEANLWLPAAAEHYKISPRLEDYVIVPVPGIFNDIPNTNGDCVTLKELLSFKPSLGMQAFKTFRGKPCFREHANKDITQAKGVILDCFIRPIKSARGSIPYYKVVMLHAFDRSKDAMLASRILSGEENAYSVGFYYSSYTCARCGKLFRAGDKPCSHTSRDAKSPVRRTYMDAQGFLNYRLCHDMEGFESSSVFDPAFVSAQSHIIL